MAYWIRIESRRWQIQHLTEAVDCWDSMTLLLETCQVLKTWQVLSLLQLCIP